MQNVPVSIKLKVPISKLRHRNHHLNGEGLVWHSRPPSSAVARALQAAPAAAAATHRVGQPAVKPQDRSLLEPTEPQPQQC
jgi:hypothetical protein